MTRRAHCAPHCYHTNSTRRVWLARVFLLCGAAAVGGRPVFSQEKSRADSLLADPFKANPAFNAPISLQVFYATAAELVKQITPTDFPYTLRVVPFDAETPVHLCAKNKPIGEVLQMCAALLNGQWREDKAPDVSKIEYVLEPKPGAVNHEKALYAETLDLNAEPMVQASRLALRHSPNYWKKEYQQIKTLPHVPDTKSLTSKRLKQANDQFFAQVLALPDGRAQAFFTVFASLTRTQRRTLSDNGYLFGYGF